MSSRLLIPSRPAIDERWSGRIQQASVYTTEMYAHLAPSPQRLNEAFEKFVASGLTGAPLLTPDPAILPHVTQARQGLVRLRDDILRDEQDELIRDAYVARIDELLANADLFEASLRGDAAAYRQQNIALYGAPDAHVYSAVCNELRRQAEDWAVRLPHLQSLCHSVLQLVPAAAHDGDVISLRPDAAVFDTQRQIHFGDDGFYAQLFEGQQLPADMVTPETGDPLIVQVLQNLQAGDLRLVDSHDGYWGVRSAAGGVIRPRRYSLTAEAFVAVVGHEIGSHLLEWLNGGRQPLRLLQTGLAGVEKGSEGRALLREQVAYHSFEAFVADFGTGWRWYEIMRRHLAVSLGAGLDGQERTFAEVFAVIHANDMLWACAHGAENSADTKSRILARTWELVSRVLNGTVGTGGAYYKDKVYLEGNLACWRLAAEDPGVVRSGDLGRVNITDPRHMQVLAAMETA